MSLPGEANTEPMGIPEDPAPPLFTATIETVQVQVEQVSQKVDACLAEIMSLKGDFLKAKPVVTKASTSPHEAKHHYRPMAFSIFAPPANTLRTTGAQQSSDSPVEKEESPESGGQTLRQTARSSLPGRLSFFEGPMPRSAMRARGVDLEVAWKAHAKMMFKDEDEHMQPMLRLVNRSRYENWWEFLDDHDSSSWAWWLWFLLKALVVASMLMSSLQTTETQLIDPVAAAVWETFVDVVFFVEVVGRVISCPSKRCQTEWFNMV